MIPSRSSALYQLPAFSGAGRKVSSSGISLVELLVAITLGMFVTLAILSSFIGQKQTMRSTLELATRIDSLRAAGLVLSRALREHGFDACLVGDGPQTAPPVTGTNTVTTIKYEPVAYLDNEHRSAISSINAAGHITFAAPHGLSVNDRINICTTQSSQNEQLTASATVASVSGLTITLLNPVRNLPDMPPTGLLITKRTTEVWSVDSRHGRLDCGKPICRSLYNNSLEIVNDIDGMVIDTSQRPWKLTLRVDGIPGRQADRFITTDIHPRNI